MPETLVLVVRVADFGPGTVPASSMIVHCHLCQHPCWLTAGAQTAAACEGWPIRCVQCARYTTATTDGM